MEAGDKLIERYHLMDKIGQGGMQEVFSAFDMVLEKRVAVKTPLPGQGDRRFKQSALLAAKVNNHAVAMTLDYFEGDEPFLVEELIEGETFEQAILSFAGFIDPHLGASIFLRLAKGVAASHHVGVIHRDLKPSNIMVSGGFAMDSLKITDFGIATLAKEVMDKEIVEGGDITKSTSGTVKGAIPYMAPEMMFRKKGDDIAEPADIWSLGAMMFKALTGQLPFGDGYDAVAAIKTGDRVPWPAFLTSDNQFAAISGELQGVIEKCLSLKQEDRPTADELIEMLSQLCFFSEERFSGKINNMPNRFFGFITSDEQKSIMFHRDSIYGPNPPIIGKRVVFSQSDGNPRPRAYPVLVEHAEA